MQGEFKLRGGNKSSKNKNNTASKTQELSLASGGAKEIKVDFNTLQDALNLYEKSLNEFRNYTDDFMKNIDKDLSTMNSDFINSFSYTIGNMKDTEAGKLVEKSEEYGQAIRKIIEEFQIGDTEISKIFKGGK